MKKAKEVAKQYAKAAMLNLHLMSAQDKKTGKWYAATVRESREQPGAPELVSASEGFEDGLDALKQAVSRSLGMI